MLTRTSLGAITALLVMSGNIAHAVDVAAFTSTYTSAVSSRLSDCNTQLAAAKSVDLYPSERLQRAKAAQECFSDARSQVAGQLNALVSTPLSADTKDAVPSTVNSLTNLGNQATTGQQDATKTANTANTQTNFLGVNFGLGAGYAFGRGPGRVTASVVNNVVRVSSDITDGPRIFLEAHYYPEFIPFTTKSGNFGWGPFATFETGAGGSTSSTGLTGFGLGIMAGFKVSNTSSSGFNVGVGYLWEGNVQTLGDGIIANQPLPTGETQVRYKNRSVGALAVLFSYKFGSSIPSDSSSTPKN